MKAGVLKRGDKVIIDPTMIYKEYNPTQHFEVEDIYRQGERFEQIKLNGYGTIHPSWLKLVEPEEVETVKTITESDFNALVTAVYRKIVSCYWTPEAEARGVVKGWMEAQNIKLIE